MLQSAPPELPNKKHFGPKVDKNYLNNSQNHLRWVNKMSVILRSQILQNFESQTLPKIISGGSKSVTYYLINCWNNYKIQVRSIILAVRIIICLLWWKALWVFATYLQEDSAVINGKGMWWWVQWSPVHRKQSMILHGKSSKSWARCTFRCTVRDQHRKFGAWASQRAARDMWKSLGKIVSRLFLTRHIISSAKGPQREQWSGGGGIVWLHFNFWNLNGQIRTRFRNLLIWLAPGSRILYFLGFSWFGISAWSATMKMFEGDGADRAVVIGVMRQGFARVGFEADQPDRDRVSSDQGFLIGWLGCDR